MAEPSARHLRRGEQWRARFHDRVGGEQINGAGFHPYQLGKGRAFGGYRQDRDLFKAKRGRSTPEEIL